MLIKVLLVAFLLASIVFVSLAAARSKLPLATGLGSAISGVGALAAVNLLSAYTGVSIALNFVTAFVAVVLSVPGVVTLLLLRILTSG